MLAASISRSQRVLVWRSTSSISAMKREREGLQQIAMAALAQPIVLRVIAGDEDRRQAARRHLVGERDPVHAAGQQHIDDHRVDRSVAVEYAAHFRAVVDDDEAIAFAREQLAQQILHIAMIFD